jgi:hypothetical protein
VKSADGGATAFDEAFDHDREPRAHDRGIVELCTFATAPAHRGATPPTLPSAAEKAEQQPQQ